MKARDKYGRFVSPRGTRRRKLMIEALYYGLLLVGLLLAISFFFACLPL